MSGSRVRGFVLCGLVVAVGVGAGCGGARDARHPATVAAPTPTPTPLATDGAAWVGTIEAPAGMTAVDDAALLALAVGAPGQGKLCAGRVYQVTAPTTVYRVWTAAKAYTQLGGWWSFTAPRGPRAAYQRDNAICAEWSALDTVSSCTIKLGTRIVVGPGQSADCEGDADFAASATNQVFIPNDTRKGQLFVEGCTAGVPWPAAAAP